jgi:DNA polymerase III delta prime subunit
MQWCELHAAILAQAFEKVLGRPEEGTMAFVRCLTPDVTKALAADYCFTPSGWRIWRVADVCDLTERTITADRAVEIREAKQDAILLLVDTSLAGAGIDGIYSAAREVDESSLFREALRLARREVTRRLSPEARFYAEQAVKKARGYGHRFSISFWTEFDFLIRVASEKKPPGKYLYLLGLWPVQCTRDSRAEDDLNLSRTFVDHLLGTAASQVSPAQRIKTLKLLNPSEEQVRDLERFLRSAATKPLLLALAELEDKEHLWVNALRVEGGVQEIQGIELSSWRTRTGKVAKWSGLIEEGDTGGPPVLVLEPDAEQTGHYSRLEVRWKARPDNLEKDAVQYRAAIVTDMDEELAFREVPHSAKKEEKCRFTNDDFSELSEDALISAKVVVSVIGNNAVEVQETEEFLIRFGQPPERERGGVGKKVRTFSEGVIELDGREVVSGLASATEDLPVDSKGFVLLRTPQRGKSFRVYRPPLIAEVERQWIERGGEIGRWRVKVRASGSRAGVAEFVPISPAGGSLEVSWESLWERMTNASRRMAERFATCGGGVGQIYDQHSKVFDTVKEYLLAWAAMLEKGAPSLALANTVEVQSLSGRTIGLIVLPSHPIRVAWHVAYDNLVLYTAFEQNMPPKDVRKELSALDGAMFPAFLPGLENGSCFVFADTLGFHAVGMIPETDKEPKATVAILARALGDNQTTETVPTVGRHSAQVLGNEIVKYIECHNTSRLLHIHALRPGDGLTVTRALGRVYEHYRQRWEEEEDFEDRTQAQPPAFVLELYPSEQQRGVAGRFIGEVREKRRSGAGTLALEDHWMLESISLPGGVNLPRLRWARKNEQNPQTAAHLAVAFDTFESRVVLEPNTDSSRSRPYYAFGLLSFFEREYASAPFPNWRSALISPTDGEKHPSDRTHTERLLRLQHVIQRCVARSISTESELPVIRTDIPPDKAQSLRELHQLCDWVITLDRNAGIEYFDSPRDNKEIYDTYVIDCVPEREDLGCLQLVTSTSNVEEVRNLLGGALDQMALSHSRRNAEFLMEHLKALSGRLAIRLTGQKAPTSELIALALSHANCRYIPDNTDCWLSLNEGFFIPIDDVRDLLPPASASDDGNEVKRARPDLIYVTTVSRKGLVFQFVEVKYRRHLRAARSPEVVESIRQQIKSLRERWENWYSHEDVCSAFRAIRRAKLARVLHFYADKAYRHYLPLKRYREIFSEIDRMVKKGGTYAFARISRGDRGWVFCPEYRGTRPLEITPGAWDTRIFLFGPGLLPDSQFRRESVASHNLIETRPPVVASTLEESRASEVPSGPNAVKVQPDVPNDSTRQEPAPSAKGIERAIEPRVCLGTDLLTGGEVNWLLTVKGNPHLLIAGLPGMGKTTCLLNLCTQMLDASIRPIVFSYHQDIDDELQRLVDSIRFVDFRGLGFNPLQVLDRSSRVAYLDVAGALRDIFVAIYPELGDIQGEHIRRAIKKSFIEKGWGDPNIDQGGLEEPDFGRFVAILRDTLKPDRGLRSLLVRLEELADYGFFDLTDSQGSLWESGEPVVIRIHKTQNDNLQKAFASLLFYGLYKDMFRRGVQSRITHAVIFDEAHRAAKLTLIPMMAKECRKYGISLVLASQGAKDFNVSLFSAIANYLVLRLTEADAKALVRNVASSDQERMLIDRIKQMERFKALYFSEARKKPSRIALTPPSKVRGSSK